MSDTSCSSSPEDAVLLKTRMEKNRKPREDGWNKVVKKLDELDTNVGVRTNIAWGAKTTKDSRGHARASKAKAGAEAELLPSKSPARGEFRERESSGLTISSLKQLRQELEEAKMERRNLLKAAQKAIKNPLKIEIPHRPEAGNARKDATNQRRKVLKEVVDALSLSLEKGTGDENRAVFDYDIEIQAVVSFVQEKFQDLMTSAVDDLKVKARAHKHKALAKAEENASQRLRNQERSMRQDQAALNQELFKRERQVDSLKKKLGSAQREAAVREKELRGTIDEISQREKKMQEKVGKALERAQKAEKRALESSNLMATQVEEIQKQTEHSISQHKHNSEAIESQLEQQKERADKLEREYEELLSSTLSDQEELKNQIEEMQNTLSPCEGLLEEREKFLQVLKEEALEEKKNTISVFEGFVKDIGEACVVSETAVQSLTEYWQQVNHGGNWIPKDRHEKELEKLHAEKLEQEERLEATQAELDKVQKILERAQTDKAIADTKVRRIAETASELRQKAEKEEKRSESLAMQLEETQKDALTSRADLDERDSELEDKANRLAQLANEHQDLEERVVSNRKEAWMEASTCLSDVTSRFSLLVTKEPIKLSKESWLEVLAAIDRTKGNAGGGEEEGGPEKDKEAEKEDFLTTLNALEGKFIHALKAICLSVTQEEKKKMPVMPLKKASKASPVKKARIKSTIPKPSPSKATVGRASKGKLASKAARSSSKAKSKTYADVQTVISAIKKARDLSCFDVRIAAPCGDNKLRRDSRGIRSLAKPKPVPFPKSEFF